MACDKSEPCAGSIYTISAPGKIILYGEHSVVYDKLAIAASLGLRTSLLFTELLLSPNKPVLVKLEMPSIDLQYSMDFKILQENLLNKPIPLIVNKENYNWMNPEVIAHEEFIIIITRFLKENINESINENQFTSILSVLYLYMAIFCSVNISVNPFAIKISTDLTISAGTGSSASFAVTLAAAFIYYMKTKTFQTPMKNISKVGYKITETIATDVKTFNEKELELISRWAYVVEKIIHGTPSGVDNTICTYGSAVEFRKSSGFQRILNFEINLLLIDTKISRNTKVLVDGVKKLNERHPFVTHSILNTMDEVSKSAANYIRKLSEYNTLSSSSLSDEMIELFKNLGELMDINHNLLQALKVSHPTLNQICEILKSFGLSGKLTGAGGGGYAIALVPPNINEGKLLM